MADKVNKKPATKKSTTRTAAAAAATATTASESKMLQKKKKSVKKAPDWSKVHSKEQSLRTKRMSVYKKANTTAVEPSFAAPTTSRLAKTKSASKMARPKFGRSPPSKRAEADAGTSFSRLRAPSSSSARPTAAAATNNNRGSDAAPRNNDAAQFEECSYDDSGGTSGGDDGFEADGGALDSILSNTGVSVDDKGLVDVAPIKKKHAAGMLNAQSAIERLRQKRKSLYNRPQPSAIPPASIEAPTYQRARLSVYQRRNEEPTLAELRENATPTPAEDYFGGDDTAEEPATPTAAFASTLSAAAAAAKLDAVAISNVADEFEVNHNALDSILGGAGVAEEISSKEMRKSIHFGALRVTTSKQNAGSSKTIRTESGMAPVTPRRRAGGVAATPRSSKRPMGGGGGGGGRAGAAPATPNMYNGGRDLPTESPFLVKGKRRQFGVLIGSPGPLDPMSAKKDAITRRLSMGGSSKLHSEPAPAFGMLSGVAEPSVRKLSETSKQHAIDALELIRREEEELELELERELEEEEAAIRAAEEAMQAKEAAAAAAAVAAAAAAATGDAAPPKVTAIVTKGGKRLTVMNFKKAKTKTAAPAPVVTPVPKRTFGGSAFKPVSLPTAESAAAAAAPEEIRAGEIGQADDDEENDELMEFAAFAEANDLAGPRDMENPVLRSIGAGKPRDYEFVSINAEKEEEKEAAEAASSIYKL